MIEMEHPHMTFKGYHCTRCGRITEDCPNHGFCPRCNGVLVLSTEETLSATMGRLHDALAEPRPSEPGPRSPDPGPSAEVEEVRELLRAGYHRTAIEKLEGVVGFIRKEDTDDDN